MVHDFKYFIVCKHNKEIRSLCIVFSEMSIYKRYYDKTKPMHIMIKDETFFDKYITTCKKISNIIIKKFNSELIYTTKNIQRLNKD